MHPIVTPFFHHDTFTATYLVQDPATGAVAVVDAVLDYEPASGRTDTRAADQIVDYVEAQGLRVEWLLETHVHADHLSAAPYLQERLGGRIAIGEHIIAIQRGFGELFNEGPAFLRDGSQFDQLFREGDRFAIGELEGRVLHTPGHTPACVTYVVGDAAFVGDTLFMPDYGTARCDFPGGSAGDLYDSIEKILRLPDDTRIFVGHDYKAEGRDDFAWESTVAAQRDNVQSGHVSRETFIKRREARDRELAAPRLILPSLQVNMRAGHLPEPEDNGTVYLKIPLNGI